MTITPQCAFRAQKASAKARGILFLFTFDQWWKIWEDSGHWFERGKLSDNYCMARIRDFGAYTIGNVNIIKHGANVREAQLGTIHSEEHNRKVALAGIGRGKSAHTRALMSQLLTGRVITEEWRTKISQTKKGIPWSEARRLAQKRRIYS